MATRTKDGVAKPAAGTGSKKAAKAEKAEKVEKVNPAKKAAVRATPAKAALNPACDWPFPIGPRPK